MAKEDSKPDETKNAKPENTEVANTEPKLDQAQDAHGQDAEISKANGNANVNTEGKPEGTGSDG